MSRTHSFPITKADQVGSRQRDCTLCPAARSLRRHGYPEATVLSELTYLESEDPEEDGNQLHCLHTPSARRWLQRYDQGDPEARDAALPAVVTITRTDGENPGQLDITGPGETIPDQPPADPAPRLRFQWLGPVQTTDPLGDELRHHTVECSNGASAVLTKQPRRAPVYLALVSNPDATTLANFYLHTNLPDARRAVERRITQADEKK